jgi:hypothetical protein
MLAERCKPRQQNRNGSRVTVTAVFLFPQVDGMARQIPRERIMLGWREWASLPRLGLPAVRCKIDSGARSSALHVDRYWRFSERGGPWVGFRLSNDGHGEAMVQAAAPVFDERDVIDSGGHRTRRIFLRTTLALAASSAKSKLT